MWTDTTQVISAMGLQATATKRKYETGSCNDDNDIYLNCAPAPKTGRWSNQINSNLTISSIATPNTMLNNCNTNIGSSIENNIAKLEAVVNVPHEPWDSEPIVDSISKLQAVAVPDAWGSDSTRSTLATTLLSADEFDDDEDDFDDEFEEDESIIPTYCPIRYPCPPQRNYGHNGYLKPNFYSEPFPQQNCSRTGNQQSQQQTGRLGSSGYSWNNQNSNYYVPPEASYPQQTIRCAENGKSYLELGSSSFSASMGARHPKRCCDGRGTWCNNKNCYKEIRLKIRNLSMFKLSRFRQVSEQSLYRSVLICNTLKYIDKEMEAEGKDAAQFGAGTEYMPAPGSIRVLTPTLQSATIETSNQSFQQSSFSSNGNNSANNNSNSNANSNNSSSSSSSSNNTSNDGNREFTQSFNTSNSAKPASSLSFNSSCSNDPLHPYDHHPFRDAMSGRATPFPNGGLHPDTDSGYGDDDSNRPINWSSVLNLTSQSALDPLNNNDLFSTIPSTSITTSTTSTNLSNSNTTSTFTASTSMSTCSVTQVSSASSTWEYGFLDMDLGLGSEFTELLPGWKLSSDDILKSVSPSLNPTKSIHETELETPTHIMVGS